MAWCEDHGVDFLLGLAKNNRLRRLSLAARVAAHLEFLRTGEPTRVFCEFDYQTRESWTRARRVIAKAEHLAKGANPRFVVTSLAPEQAEARPLYEELYCARGDMENRIKEQQLMLFADRTSCHDFQANQFRLLLSSCAYVLVQALRRIALTDTELGKAQVSTIRLKLLKIAARVTTSVRRVVFHLASPYPYQQLFRQVCVTLFDTG